MDVSVPALPDDLEDREACERWIKGVYPRDQDTYPQGMHRLAQGMIVLMRAMLEELRKARAANGGPT